MKLQTLGSAAFAAALLCATAAQASPYIVTFEQLGSDVVATGSGEFDTTGLSTLTPQFAIAFVSADAGSLALGSPGSIQEWVETIGPVRFGTGLQTNASSGTGDVVGLQNGVILFTPLNYVSGDPLNDTATFDNSTFASLGLTPGTYVWSWGTGADQTFTLQVGPTATPLPTALPLFATGLGGLGLLGWRRKKKAATLAA